MMRDCPKCGSSQVEEGFEIDKAHGERVQAAFHKGKPDKRWWGLKTSKADTLPITQYRCARCGYLESYAI
ncbi:hypothetical protein [Sphingomicrobium sediminis]|uniref:Uncharacterized protein n=1 Tax=Sphingomicrobium sediminis TaxID=2950949 RepID=A0A9X2EGW0_9SPHN|nr:hypothetical protein [Sphingomicrobium sediminis]MCM8557242.1 hypothetical protein [Sphingomicrobium sediminis]